MGHPQPPTPGKTDNLTSKGILTNLVKPAKYKLWDMKHHWISDTITDKIINIIWRPGTKNWAYYFTKHHLVAHHKIL